MTVMLYSILSMIEEIFWKFLSGALKKYADDGLRNDSILSLFSTRWT